ncbi:hypothetical protein AB0D27_17820 [Streptomyces sp. NPDC048415]|uniref:hypothetical protein n=1 Tax=Streptomyces sp. NPDC048415 TaxID=3154822 RepID=UPI003441EF91
MRAQDMPGAIGRAVHAAREGRGPALVLVPMDDWAEPAEDLPVPAHVAVRRSASADPQAVAEVADLPARASLPAPDTPEPLACAVPSVSDGSGWLRPVASGVNALHLPRPLRER